ncbi:MAG: hypothetical protein GKR89_23120 [Candidatus Latescibacteria bacterium]|nr:hypothetical protein [Candidatus Latescibacterota bacterium]
MQIRHLNPDDPVETVIGIEGLEQALHLMHITDSHFAEWDQRDSEEAQADGERVLEIFQSRTPEGALPRQVFSQALARSNALGVDATVLTGDIIHFPAWAGIEALEAEIGILQAPYLYTLGNHDWHFAHQPWGPVTRADHYRRFTGLTDPGPAAQARRLGDVLLVALDNSTYQLGEAQVDFLRQQLDTGMACLLFIHIPVDIPTLRPDIMERWKAPIAMGAEDGWDEESRKKWLTDGVEPATRAFMELIQSERAAKLAGIFCGHVHFVHADAFAPGRFQYVTKPGFEGGYRQIRLQPLD